MKKSIFYSLFATATLSLFQSCSSIKWVARDTATMDVTKSGIITRPKIADLKIETARVSGSASGTVKEETLESIKSKALQNALELAKADILVEPIYEVEREDKILTAKVTGFPAKVTDFKDISASDTLSLSIASKFYIPAAKLNTNDASKSALQENIKAEKKKNLRKKIGLGFGLGLGLPLIIGLGLGLGIGG